LLFNKVANEIDMWGHNISPIDQTYILYDPSFGFDPIAIDLSMLVPTSF
jgi:hypothetical protein